MTNPIKLYDADMASKVTATGQDILRQMTKPLMVANDFAKMVNELRDLSIQYHNHQSLRERIAGVVHQYIQPASKKEVEQGLTPSTHDVKVHSR